MKTCKRYTISGHVQGVWYRASTKEHAEALGITGHARNLTDGRVEVLACGQTDIMNELEAWLWQGPPLAKVEHIDSVEIAPRNINGFTTA